jgi:hypothetical protein
MGLLAGRGLFDAILNNPDEFIGDLRHGLGNRFGQHIGHGVRVHQADIGFAILFLTGISISKLFIVLSFRWNKQLPELFSGL